MTLRRIATAAEMQGRDLLRRRGALALLVVLPVAFYLSTELTDEGDLAAYTAGGIAMGWSIAGAALFSVLASRRSDPRLVLAGYGPAELLLGRLLLLQILAVAVLVAFAGLVEVVSDPPDRPSLAAGLALAGVVGATLGLAAAVASHGELEGMLAIIGVVGINMSVPPNAPAAPFLPFYGSSQFLSAASGIEQAGASAIAHGIAYAIGLFILASLLWTRRVRVDRG